MNPHKIGQGRVREKAPREPFTFPFLRDEEVEEHTFLARASLDLPTLLAAMAQTDAHPERSMASLLRLIPKMLDNRDGTPAQWRPEVLPSPEAGHDADEELKFRAPDGTILPFDRAAEFTAFAAGSSRRRWLHLINEDDEIETNVDDLMELYKFLISLAGKGRTPKSG